MRRPPFPAALATGLALLLAANAVVLAGAAWNRWEGPRAKIVLTERELSLPEYREEENSSFSLSLLLADDPPPGVARTAWRKRIRLPRPDHAWLTRAKLRELGFRTDRDPSDPEALEAYQRQIARHVYLALEFEGDAWRRYLASREESVGELRRRVNSGAADRKELQDAEALLALDRVKRSRLLVVDAGLDPEALRRRHSGPGIHLVFRGIIALHASPPGNGVPRLEPFLQVLPDRVHVPAGMRLRLAPFLPRETRGQAQELAAKESEEAWPSPTPSRYRVTLAFGRRLEPWILDVTPGD